MARAYASVAITAPIDRVWSFVRDFDNLPDWHPLIASSTIEDDHPAARVGCVRRLGLTDGATIREQLLCLDDVDHSYTYTFLQSPFPVRSYRCTLQLRPITASDHTFAAWWTDFDAEAKDEDELIRTFGQDVFGTGLAALRSRFTDS